MGPKKHSFEPQPCDSGGIGMVASTSIYQRNQCRLERESGFQKIIFIILFQFLWPIDFDNFLFRKK